MTEAVRDRWGAVIVALLAFALYVRTLAPGLIGIVDTPMFQFVGRVLGVAHNPGYPLFVLITYPFSYLPIGSLAYRINLFSAVMGAVTVAIVYGIARRLGCRPVIAMSAALALACGQTFWSQAVIAEVYTLNSALLAGSILLLLRWRESGRLRHLYGSVALFALGLSNHITILGLLPGMLLFVAWHDRALLGRPAVWMRTAAIVGAGLLPYAFILVRSRQPGAYVESRAQSLAELGRVMTGRRFAGGLFVYDWTTILTERVPFVFEWLTLPELTWAGFSLACAGLVLLWVRQRGAALLLASPAFAVAAFITNYRVIDSPVFMIPAWVVVWPAAGFAVEQIARGLRSTRHATLISFVALLMPALLAARNYEPNDRSRDVSERIYFDSLFEALPDGAVIVREDFLVDRMVMYKLLGEGDAKRGIGIADATVEALSTRIAAGAVVYAFPGGAETLRLDGLDVDFAPLRLRQGALGAYVERLPPDTIVGVAVPAVHAAAFAAEVADDAIRVQNGTGGLTLTGRAVNLFEAPSTGAPPPGFTLRADALETAVTFDGRDLARTADGAILATWSSTGAFQEVFVLRASEHFEVPFTAGPLSVRRVRAALPTIAVNPGECRDTSPAWAEGSVRVRLPRGAAATATVRDLADTLPRLVAGSLDAITMTVAATEGRLHLAASGGAAPGSVAIIALGTTPSDVQTCLSGAAAGEAAEFTRIDSRDLLRPVDTSRSVLTMHRDDQTLLVGAGWSAVEVDGGGPFRRMTGTRAHLLVPVHGAAEPVSLELQLRADADSPAAVMLLVNGTPIGSRPPRLGWHREVWSVPRSLVKDGTNTVVLELVPGGGSRGPAVASLMLVRGR